jgi:hypothetical protein
VRTLHLIAGAESLCPLVERLVAFGTTNFYSVSHKILPPVLMSEGHANPLFPAPDNTTILTIMAACDVQCDFVRNANRGSPRLALPRPEIANCAIDAAAVELNCSGFKNALSRCCAPLIHAATLS